ncbi:MAG TPA: ABC transporter ATP-binding protein, partial [Gammaproteobacteria bacterium]|nr:ABC transporter ATP-binding protein [Gammaproteobacteria bacterium]
GLIGPNGAGKTTDLNAILGLTNFEGEMEVLGHDPRLSRRQLMQDVCFIADVATLPRWLKVANAIEFVEAVHPRFSRERARHFLERTKISQKSKVGQLSQGMVPQLHLALIMALDAKLLVLDEPTIGLDILYRKEFYSNLLNDYFDEKRTILITTHQVEEIEKLLTHLMFINNGRIVLNDSMEAVAEKYAEVLVAPDKIAAAQALNPINEREIFGKKLFLFEGIERSKLAGFGEIHTPSIADLFVAKMQGAVQ